MTINTKNTVNPIIESMTICVDEKDYYGCIAIFHREILSKRAKFPILEYAARRLFSTIPECVQIAVCDKINGLNEMGGSIVTGTALQMRLEDHFEESIEKSIEYVKGGNEWFHCDHLAERVLGHALMTDPQKSMPVLRKLVTDDDKWIVRMAGVAGHFAVKNGLGPVYVNEIFRLLLEQANNGEFHVQRGIGRAAGTTAKLHPEIAANHKKHLQNDQQTGNWFRASLESGISSG